MPVRPAIGRPTDRAPPQLTSPSDRLWACDCEGALSKPREARHRHGAPFVLRFSVAPCRSVTSATSVFSRSGEAAPRDETLTHGGG